MEYGNGYGRRLVYKIEVFDIFIYIQIFYCTFISKHCVTISLVLNFVGINSRKISSRILNMSLSSVQPSSNECIICAEKMNNSTRKCVVCQYCEYKSCRACCEKYILNVSREKCMNTNCDKIWTREFVRENFTIKFINGALKEKKESLVFEREKAMLPATQEVVERMNASNILMQEIKKHEDEISYFNTLIRCKKHLINGLSEGLYTLEDIKHFKEFGYINNKFSQEVISHDTANKKAPTTNKYIRKCPFGDCRGFINMDWMCGMCDNYTCKVCFEIKGKKEDCDGHVCNPSNVESARLIASDSRPCPGCSSLIYKIEGCDQMFCTCCNTAFSWRTGKIESGNIHNPHYFEYLRKQNNGDVPRNPNDIVGACGRQWAVVSNMRNETTHFDNLLITVINNIVNDNYAINKNKSVMNLEESAGDVGKENYGKKELRRSERIERIKSSNANKNAGKENKDEENEKNEKRRIFKFIHERINEYVRSLREIQSYHIQHNRPDVVHDNEKYRIRYLTGKINENEFKKLLIRAEKTREKNTEHYNIFTMVITVGTDILSRFVDTKDLSVLFEFDNIYEYAHELVKKLNQTFISTSKYNFNKNLAWVNINEQRGGSSAANSHICLRDFLVSIFPNIGDAGAGAASAANQSSSVVVNSNISNILH
jgi:hypothetical protein